jgi:hypothetical protein
MKKNERLKGREKKINKNMKKKRDRKKMRN